MHFGVQVLQPANFGFAADGHCLTNRVGRRNGGGVEHLVLQGGAANREGIADRLLALGGVDDQVHLVVLDHVDDMRTPFQYFIDRLHVQPGLGEHARGAARGHQPETMADQ